MNMIETKPLCASASNLTDMLAKVRGWTLLILQVRGQRSRSQLTHRNKHKNTIQTKPFCASSSNLADMLAIVKVKGQGHNRRIW